MNVRFLSLAFFSILAAACSSSTNVADGSKKPGTGDTGDPGDTPGDQPPACSADEQHENVLAVDARGPFQTPTPLVASTADRDGVAAVWFDGVSQLKFRRWNVDGTPAIDESVVATKMNLPGGDAALRSIAIARAGEAYLLAYEDFGTKAVFVRVVDADGKSGDARQLSSATREIGTGASKQTGAVTASSPSLRAHGDNVFVSWHESVKLTATSYSEIGVLQALDPSGAAMSKQALTSSRTAVDGEIAGDRFKMIDYRQGAGSIADLDPLLRQASASSDLTSWTDTVLKLPRPDKGDVGRGYATLLSTPNGTAFVDLASFVTGPTNDRVRRVEIADLDDLGAVTKTRSIDLEPTRTSVSNPVATVDGDTLYVAWIDGKDDQSDRVLHAVAVDTKAGTTKTADAKLSMKFGYLDSLAGVVSGIDAKNGAARVSYAWGTLDANQNRQRHVGLQSFCFATR